MKLSSGHQVEIIYIKTIYSIIMQKEKIKYLESKLIKQENRFSQQLLKQETSFKLELAKQEKNHKNELFQLTKTFSLVHNYDPIIMQHVHKSRKQLLHSYVGQMKKVVRDAQPGCPSYGSRSRRLANSVLE